MRKIALILMMAVYQATAQITPETHDMIGIELSIIMNLRQDDAPNKVDAKTYSIYKEGYERRIRTLLYKKHGELARASDEEKEAITEKYAKLIEDETAAFQRKISTDDTKRH